MNKRQTVEILWFNRSDWCSTPIVAYPTSSTMSSVAQRLYKINRGASTPSSSSTLAQLEAYNKRRASRNSPGLSRTPLLSCTFLWGSKRLFQIPIDWKQLLSGVFRFNGKDSVDAMWQGTNSPISIYLPLFYERSPVCRPALRKYITDYEGNSEDRSRSSLRQHNSTIHARVSSNT